MKRKINRWVWTVQDEAIHRGNNYADANLAQIIELRKDEGMSLFAVLKNAYRSDFTVAGGKTPPAKTTNDLPVGTTSPMTKVKRPPRPATGANPRG